MSSITLHIKSSNESKFSVTVNSTDSVKALKEAISKHLESSTIPTPVENQRLIYAGRVLKDEEVLTTYKIAEGNTIHLVRSGLQKSTTAAAVSPSSTTAAGATSATSATAPSPSTPAAAPTPASTPAATGPALGGNPFASMFGANAPGGAPGGGLPGGFGGLGGGFGGMDGAGMGGMDPSLLNTMAGNPAVAQAMAQLMASPDFVDMMAASNPRFAQMMTPEMRAMMQSEGFRRMMADPNMIRAMMQMTPGIMGGGVNPFAAGAGAGASLGNPPASSPAAGGAPAMNPTGAGGFDPALLSLLMGGMGGLNPAAAPLPPPPANPEETYQVQLRQLQDMGFYDASENIRALTATRGNVEAAVEFLFNNPPPGYR